MSYRHILLAADLIPHDDNPVAQRAVALAKAAGADLSLIHVVEPVYNYGAPYVAGNIVEWQDELEKSAQSSLSKLGEELGVPNDKQFLPTGSPKQHILEIAEKVGADLIVVGSHGRHGLSLLLMGSTANAVLHGATCDVLSVRVPDQDA